MQCVKFIAALIAGLCIVASAAASVEFSGGIWTKTTHPDPQNVSIFYVDDQTVKAVGYGRMNAKPAIWYADGSYRNGHLTLRYRYSPSATPDGWEPEGTLQLEVSADGNRLSGTARAQSGAWSGRLEFRRIDANPN